MVSVVETEEDAIIKKMEHYRRVLENNERLNRLKGNVDFQKIILQGYCMDHVSESLRWSIQPNVDECIAKNHVNEAQAPIYLMQYMESLARNAETAYAGLRDSEAALEDIRTGE